MDSQPEKQDQPAKILAALNTTQVPAEDGEGVSITEKQLKDLTLQPIIQYLQEGTLPVQEPAKKLLSSKLNFLLLDHVLYHQESDKMLRIVVPSIDRYKLFKEVHAGKFGGHLRDAKIHSQLTKTY